MRIERHRRATGILLVEALVAFMIFLIAAISFYGLLAHSRRAETKARQTLTASALARELMEGERLKGYNSLKVGVQKGTRQMDTSRDGRPGRSQMTYLIQVYDGPGPGVRSIQVFVEWNDGRLDVESYVVQ